MYRIVEGKQVQTTALCSKFHQQQKKMDAGGVDSFDLKPGRRDGRQKDAGKTTRSPRATGGPRTKESTIKVIVPEGYELKEDEVVREGSLNHHRAWETVDRLKKEGKHVVEVTTEAFDEAHRVDPVVASTKHSGKVVTAMKGEEDEVMVRKGRSGPVVKTNQSKSSRKKKQQQQMNIALAQAAGPVYIVETEMTGQ